MKVTLKIKHQGVTREEVADLTGSSTGALMKAAMEHVEKMNEGLAVDDRHVLLSLKPGEHVTAPYYRSLGLPTS